MAEQEVLPTGSRHGMGTLAWSPLGAWVLVGRYPRGTGAHEAAPDSRLGRVTAQSERLGRFWARSLLTERKLDIADAVAAVATELGVSSAAVAVTWVLRRDYVTSVVIGPRTLDHLPGILSAYELDLPAEIFARLEKVSRC